MELGQRVVVAGTVDRYGYITGIQRGVGSVYYMVRLDNNREPSGPFTEVWPKLEAPPQA